MPRPANFYCELETKILSLVDNSDRSQILENVEAIYGMIDQAYEDGYADATDDLRGPPKATSYVYNYGRVKARRSL